MENQRRKISGYRELSQQEIDLMNAIKEEAERFGQFFSKDNPEDEDGFQERSACIEDLLSNLKDNESLDQKWVVIGDELIDTAIGVTLSHDFDRAVTEMQLGFMALVRSVAKPTTF